MVERPRRTEVEESRPEADPAWEVFARDDAGGPLRYVGRIRAGTAADAHAEATRLFCWYAREVWVCPAESVRKFSAEGATEDDADPATPEIGSEDRTYEP